MQAGVVSIAGNRQGAYAVLEAAVPERAPRPIGIILVDPESDRGWIKLRREYEEMASTEDAEVLEAIEGDLRGKLEEMGAEACLSSLEDSLSNVLRVGERQAVTVDAFSRVLERLYGEWVEPVVVGRFATHVPLYSLRAAAGQLGEEMASVEEDWVPAPAGVHVTPDLFVAHVVGRSMEPRIPDGSLNLFRLHPAGSRQNKILLIQRFGAADETARYTVKKYTSRKVEDEQGRWRHERIRLEPLNPEFEAWDAGPEDFAVVAEWLRVLE